MTQRPSQAYAAGVAGGAWQDDPAQRAVLTELDRLHAQLLAANDSGGGLLASLFGKPRAAAAPRGVYLWGGVGRGKTFLVDLFYDQLGDLPRQRTHFHRFMREVHARLKQHAGERDPMAQVARDWRQRMRLLVLDEFVVTDIGDAMLLARVLERLFAEDVVLVTTSNTPPRNLYKDGLQRARFEPAIALIEAHCQVVEIASPIDYRLRALTASPVYRAPLDAQSDAWLAQRWLELVHAPAVAGRTEIEGRLLPVRGEGHGAVWFDFAALCEGPRAASDYIDIASEFHTVLVGDIPVFDDRNDDPARRFVNAIDEFYDRRVNLVCTAAAAPLQLYRGERLAPMFERTASRLIEMQSADYLAGGHLG